MKEEVETLWKLCFNDSEAFTEMYFNERYSDEITIAVREDSRLISALQMIPYPMTFCGDIIETSYISGACTHPDYRSKGYMKQLLSKAFSTMFSNDILLSTLIPAEKRLFDYYQRQGYVPIFSRSTTKLTRSFKPIPEVQISNCNTFQEEVYAYFDRKMKERSLCILHTPEDFRVILADFRLSKGALWVAHFNEEIVGIAFGVRHGKTLHILELLTDNQVATNALLSHGYRETKSEQVEITSMPGTGKKDSVLGMARVIHAEELLKQYAAVHKDTTLSFYLTDEMLPENEGRYHLFNGTCIKEKKKPACRESVISIQQLTQALFGYEIGQLPQAFYCFSTESPYMSLMLN